MSPTRKGPCTRQKPNRGCIIVTSTVGKTAPECRQYWLAPGKPLVDCEWKKQAYDLCHKHNHVFEIFGVANVAARQKIGAHGLDKDYRRGFELQKQRREP